MSEVRYVYPIDLNGETCIANITTPRNEAEMGAAAIAHNFRPFPVDGLPTVLLPTVLFCSRCLIQIDAWGAIRSDPRVRLIEHRRYMATHVHGFAPGSRWCNECELDIPEPVAVPA